MENIEYEDKDDKVLEVAEATSVNVPETTLLDKAETTYTTNKGTIFFRCSEYYFENFIFKI